MRRMVPLIARQSDEAFASEGRAIGSPPGTPIPLRYPARAGRTAERGDRGSSGRRRPRLLDPPGVRPARARALEPGADTRVRRGDHDDDPAIRVRLRQRVSPSRDARKGGRGARPAVGRTSRARHRGGLLGGGVPRERYPVPARTRAGGPSGEGDRRDQEHLPEGICDALGRTTKSTASSSRSCRSRSRGRH